MNRLRGWYDKESGEIVWSERSPHPPVYRQSVSLTDLCNKLGVSNVWNDIDVEPMEITSRRQLKEECKRRGLESKHLM